MRYREIAKAHLEKTNPKAGDALKAEKKMGAFLTETVETAIEQEETIFDQMVQKNNLPEDPIERARALNMLKMTAREISTAHMTEFLDSLEE